MKLELEVITGDCFNIPDTVHKAQKSLRLITCFLQKHTLGLLIVHEPRRLHHHHFLTLKHCEQLNQYRIDGKTSSKTLWYVEY